MSEEQPNPTRIDVSRAIEMSYWYGMVDGIRDTYRMVFKEPAGNSKLNTALTETLDRVMELGNLEDKYMAFVLAELTQHNDVTNMKQALWSTVLLGLPDFRKEIVYNGHIGNVKGQLRLDIENAVTALRVLEK